ILAYYGEAELFQYPHELLNLRIEFLGKFLSSDAPSVKTRIDLLFSFLKAFRPSPPNKQLLLEAVDLRVDCREPFRQHGHFTPFFCKAFSQNFRSSLTS